MYQRSVKIAGLAILFSYLSMNAHTYHFHHIASNKELTSSCRSFLSSVLCLEKTEHYLDKALNIILETYHKPLPDLAYYQYLQQYQNELNPHYDIPYKINLINYQKNLLSAQAHELLDLGNKVDGALEIGTPGTYLSAILPEIPAYENIYIINEQQQLSDYAQAFSLSPSKNFLIYDTFIPLNNYEPIHENNIPDNSLDLCVCFIGLHHIPQERLEDFVASIARVLRPGGVFLLRDHDAYNDDIKALAYAAHSLFNILVPHEPIETELAEYRNFQPLSFWIDLLAKHGLQVGDKRLLQEGDATLNTLLTFTKKASSPEENEAVIRAKLHNKTNIRDQLQTYLTSPEWYNVDISQNYGSFINHTPFYEYPYLASATTYWKILACSIATAAKKHGWFNTLTSSYNLMNIFIGTTMSIEYTAKACISLPIRYMYSGQEDAFIQVMVKDSDNILHTLHPDIKTLHKDTATQMQLVELPRYKSFSTILQKIAQTSVELYEIAGHDEITCKIRYSTEKKFPTTIPCTQEYNWAIPTEPDYVYAVISVKVNVIKQVITELAKEHIKLLYIHDF